jgi:hypothetical protein
MIKDDSRQRIRMEPMWIFGLPAIEKYSLMLTWLSNRIFAISSLMCKGRRGCSMRMTFLAFGSVINELYSHSIPSVARDQSQIYVLMKDRPKAFL